MQNRCQRTHKIDLTISRRARSALSQSLHTQFQSSIKQNQKKSKFHKKALHLTISRITFDHHYPIYNKNHNNMLEEANLVVSQIVFPSKDKDKAVPETKTMLNSVQEIQNEDQDRWWEYLHDNESGSKKQLIQQLLKAQKKIQYFNALLKHNTLQYKLQRSETVTKYESFITKLKQIYSQQQGQNSRLQQIAKNIEQRKTEQLYHLLRTKINRDGQRGLNFSPKRLSVFSGISEALLLSNKSNESEERGMGKESLKFQRALKVKMDDSSHNNCGRFQSLKQLEKLIKPDKWNIAHVIR